MTKMFEIFCAVFLTITASGKLFLLAGSSRILIAPDPVFGVENQSLLLFTGLLELACVAWSVCCLVRDRSSAIPLALISTAILFYRTMLYVVGFKGYCNCLGAFSDSLPISQSNLSTILLTVALVMYIYSITSLVCELSRHKVLQQLNTLTSE